MVNPHPALPKKDIYDYEASDGIRLSWNTWPNSNLNATRIVVPVGALYTPMKTIENLPVLEYEALVCKGCGGVLNPFVHVDYRAKCWTCCFCQFRNSFPPHYAEHISESNLPAELVSEYSTIEYVLPETVDSQVFLYVVDTAISADELVELKDSIQQSLNLLPPDSFVGLITFGRVVFVHELGFTEFAKSYAFDGTKEYKSQNVLDQLGIYSRNDPRSAQAGKGMRRFILPVSECEFMFNSIIDDLQSDPWPLPAGERPMRATGCAALVGISMLEGLISKGSRMIMFTGGAVSVGPGQIVSEKKSETLRSHLDIQRGSPNTKYMKKAMKFYEDLADKACTIGAVIDIYICSLDQIGLLEMKVLSEVTGGSIVMADSCKNAIFKKSFIKLFERDNSGLLKIGSGATMSLLTSKVIKIHGAIGNCSSLKKKSSNVSDTNIGVGGTSMWSLGGIDKDSTYAFYFEIVNTAPTTANIPIYLQFLTRYLHSSGHFRLRITTIQRKLSIGEDLKEIARGFDQEAAAVLMARYAVHRTLNGEETIDVLRWLDRLLIKLAARFGEYRREDPGTFRLPKEFQLYPQFMYHLRRSNFLQTFGESPDESCYFRSHLLKQTVGNCLLMIQPALLQYTPESAEGAPVLLEMASLKAGVILLYDTFFHVLIWNGETVAKWRDAEYHKKPEYENIKAMMETPVEDADQILAERFPVPKFIICDQGDGTGQERLIKTKVIPSNQSITANLGADYINEDVSLALFVNQLFRLAIQSNN